MNVAALIMAGGTACGGIPVAFAGGRRIVLHYGFADGGFVMVRPSGTEPKLKPSWWRAGIRRMRIDGCGQCSG